MISTGQAFRRAGSPPDGSLHRPIGPIGRSLLRHPYLLLLAACLAVNLLFDGSIRQTLSKEAPAVAFLLSIFAALLVAVIHPGRRSIWWATGVGIGSLFLFAGMATAQNVPRYLLIVGFSLLAAIALFLALRKRLSPLHLAVLLVIAGFLLRTAYILYTRVSVRQHDVWSFGQDLGHAGYISYLYENLALPDFNPLSRWQYYHPPLHHFLAALWMRGNTLLGMSLFRAQESIQILTLFYSGSCMITGYKIFRRMKLKGLALIVPLAILCFHPTFIIMAGSINNDILSVALSFGAVYGTLRWMERPTLRRILPIALCVGGSMMAKLSGALIAPAIAAVFLMTLWQEWRANRPLRLRSRPVRLVGQYAAFGCLCIPLGLWWGIRNLVRFGVPIGYVPLLSTKEAQYIGTIPVLKRLFDYSPHQLSPIFMAWGNRNADYFEYNPIIGLLKTSVFGEFDLANGDSAIYAGGVVLFFVNLLLALAAFVALLYFLFRPKGPLKVSHRVFWGLLTFVLLGSYLQFCLAYPHTCTQNFRYLVPILSAGTVGLGLLLQQGKAVKAKATKVARWVITGAAVLFCGASSYLFYMIAK